MSRTNEGFAKKSNQQLKATSTSEVDLTKIDLEYLVTQYEILHEMYASPEAVGREKMAKIRKIFDLVDADGSGTIDSEEAMKMALTHWSTLGFTKKPTVEEVLEFFKEMDSDGSNSVTYEEFTLYLMNMMKMKYVKPLTDYFQSLGLRVEC